MKKAFSNSIVNALNISRRWDIVLTGDEQIHFSMKEAIVNFQNDFANTLLLAPENLDFSYESYLKQKIEENECQSMDEYLTFYEENAFVEEECRKLLKLN